MLKQAGLDAEARDVAERIQGVLTDEIHHRMKNMLAMVTAIVRQSMRTAANLVDAEAAISIRLLAMAKAHDLLLKADWKTAGLREVVQGAIEQHNTPAGRINASGENVQVISSSILPLTLALNELCTNAVKYGALSKDRGRVDVSWTADAATVTLRWVESGGPAVAMPQRKSFGTRLIEQALPRQLGGTGQLSFLPSGVVFTLTFPLALEPADTEGTNQKALPHA